jgi:flagellar assembly factor FliW
MQVQTTRFGAIEIGASDIIEFAEGLLGFADARKFVLLDDPDDDIFAWLQSCEHPNIAFPVLEPELFMPEYKINLSKRDLEALDMKEMKGYCVYTIITIPEDPTQMTANLKAPIVIHIGARKARQCVLQDNDLPIRQSIFSQLQQRLVQGPIPENRPAKNTNLAVRIIPQVTT